MEPTQNENFLREPFDQTSKKHNVVSPRVLLPGRGYEPKDTSPEVPAAGLPILSTDDMQWYGNTPPAASSSNAQTPPLIPRTSARETNPSYPIQNVPTLRTNVRETNPSYPAQNAPTLRTNVRETNPSYPAQNAPTPGGRPEEQTPPPLVKLLPYPSDYVKGNPNTTMRPTGSYRWEQQTTRYPAELLQIMESETREMQALVAQSPAKAARDAQPKRKLRKKRRRVPEMRQVTAVECGATCIAMVLNYYGHATSISEVQERCGVGRDGLTALEIVKSARLYGLRVRAVSLNLEDFRFVELPAIVHWEFNHFLIVERWSRNRIDVVDPARGRRTLTPEEFDEGFTGVALMLEPGTQFEQKAAKKTFTLWSYLRSFITMRMILVQIISTSLVLQVLGLASPLLTEVVIDRILPQKDPNLLTVLAVGMLILVLMQGVTSFLRSSLLIYLQTRLDTDMTLNFFEHLLSLPYRYFQLRLNGDLLARMSSNQAIRDLLTNQLISTLLDGVSVVVYFIVLFVFSRLYAEVALAMGGVEVALLLLSSPAIRRLTQRDLEARGKTQGYMTEVLAGIATVKAAGAEQRVFGRWENLFFDEMNVSLRLSYLSSVMGTLLGIVGALSPLLLLWIGAMQVLDGTMTVGTMLAFSTLAIQFLTPLSSLATVGQELQVVGAHFSRVADVISAQPEQDPTAVQVPHQLRGQIELRQVSFQYDQNAPMILRNINAKISPGQKVALVGRTGSGKSTLGKLLVGLMAPTTGAIFYDGVPLEEMSYQDVRSQFGVVLQESFIFSGSVKDNIALNNPEMDMERIMEAAQLAAIDEDVEKMSMGYDTLVSEGGSAFSGGQRQRLALARALANHPSLLLLDEATSALDVVTEQVVEQNLRRLPCTQVIIAHRLSTIRNADVILLLDRGNIVEQGTHDQLLRRNGFYAQLIQTQLQNGEIAAV